MSNARYSNIKNLPAQLKSADVGNLNVADTVTTFVMSSDVAAGLVPFTTAPAGKQIQKVMVHSDGAGAWRADATPTPMVTAENGSTNFEFPDDAVIVAAHLEASTPVAGSVSLTVRVGGSAIFTGAPIASVNTVGVGAQVCSHGSTNIIGGTGSVTLVSVSQGDTVDLTSNTASTAGVVFACIYYYV